MNFSESLIKNNISLKPTRIDTLQVNLTKLCNQACRHCHVDSSPHKTESMSEEHVEKLLTILKNNPFKVLDLTGGAPELHPQFKEIILFAKKLEKHIIVRHNLTVAFDPHPRTKKEMTWLHDFFYKNEVEVVSSLPFYKEYLTDKQRGRGVFKKSILGLQELNKRGYGQKNTGLILNLVYNPVGAYLPPTQDLLEADYKKELKSLFDIKFNHLYTITNMPIKRFKEDLIRRNQYDLYMDKLVSSFNPAAAQSIMCRNTLSVSWDGRIYHCDFNQMLDYQSHNNDKSPINLENFHYDNFIKENIVFANHCYGCTAGSGSSCGGSLT